MEFTCANCSHNKPGTDKQGVKYDNICWAINPPTVITDVNKVLTDCPLDDTKDRQELTIRLIKKGLI